MVIAGHLSAALEDENQNVFLQFVADVAKEDWARANEASNG